MTTIIALHAPKREPRFDAFAEICSALSTNRVRLTDGDVFVISSKYVALAQGRTVSESSISASAHSRNISKKLEMRPALAETVLRESEHIIGGVAGFAMTLAEGMLAPNAGVDSSNARGGEIILYPEDSYEAAEQLRRKIFLEFGVNAGVIISDSRLQPMRAGTCGVAVAFAGIEPVHDQRGEADLDGRPLLVTKKATADNIATMANYEMGEGSESTPFALVRGAPAKLTHKRAESADAAVTSDECVYMRSIRG